MGSAVPRKRDPARELLLRIDLTCRQEGQREAIAALLADALDNPSTRCATLLGLSKYLSTTLQGSIPDLDYWSGE